MLTWRRYAHRPRAPSSAICARVNQRASMISAPSGVGSSPSTDQAWKPNMRELGNGQGWLPR